MKILSIGNSFSQDAHRYLHSLSKENGQDMKCVNLYIGGCTLRQHYLNILDDEEKYSFEFNGETTGLDTSVRKALKSDEWDYVSLQQGSHKSFDFDSFTPYIQKINDYVKLYSPKSKILIHQTWGYEDNSERLMRVGYDTMEDMFADIKQAYRKAFERIKADKIIPVGEAVLIAYRDYGIKVHRDTFHLSRGFARYLAAMVWYKFLFDTEKILRHQESFDVDITQEEKKLADVISTNVYKNSRKNSFCK